MKGSADFRPDAWARVTARLVADIDGLSVEAAERLLTDARVNRPKTLNAVDCYLAVTPGGVCDPDAACPRGMMRLSHVLLAAGYTAVHPPQCTQCGQRSALTNVGPSGRICEHCLRANRPAVLCARCGKPALHRRNSADGVVCSNCYSRDPSSKAPCHRCGRVGHRRRRLPCGGVLCPACAPRPQHTCVECGKDRPAQSITENGPICSTCYSRINMSWSCAACGALRRRKSGGNVGPHICGICRRALRNDVQKASTRTALPASRPPRVAPICVFCRRQRPIMNRWPAGPVCKVCAKRARSYPGICGTCQQSAVLIGLNDHGGRICGPCAGASLDYRCRNCGQAGMHANGRCSRCVTAQLLDAALGGHDGQIPDQLRPLADALAAAPDPRSVAVWLARSDAARLLRTLAECGETVTHDLLDALPPGRQVNYIREILVRTSVLPMRNERLERLEPWLDRYLADQPADHTLMVRNYAVWYLLHRARRSPRPLVTAGAARIRRRVRVALEFLTWCDARGRSLTDIDQGDVDTWLATGDWRRPEVRPFLHWTTQRRITGAVSAPAPKPAPPSVFIDEATHLEQLHRCLHDDGIDVDLRAAGALILLYGIATWRVLNLRRNQVHTRDGETFLVLRDHELLLPPQLADLMAQLPRSTRRSTLPDSDASDRLLFPGRTPDRPVDTGGFGKRLKRSGLTIRAGKNTALLGLAAELPAAVLADLLAIDVGTATRWATYAKTEWNDYIAARTSGDNG